jgi:hypothetical protein
MIAEGIEKLYDTAPKGMWHQQDIATSVEALHAFLNIIDDLKFDAFEPVSVTDSKHEMTIEGVVMSVRPDLRS